MGYYCDVTIQCREGIYKVISDLWEHTSFPTPKVIKHIKDHYYIQWFDIKWYSEWLAETLAPVDVMSKTLAPYWDVDTVEHPELGLGMVILGEDITDIEIMSNCDDMRPEVTRTVYIPAEAEAL